MAIETQQDQACMKILEDESKCLMNDLDKLVNAAYSLNVPQQARQYFVNAKTEWKFIIDQINSGNHYYHTTGTTWTPNANGDSTRPSPGTLGDIVGTYPLVVDMLQSGITSLNPSNGAPSHADNVKLLTTCINPFLERLTTFFGNAALCRR